MTKPTLGRLERVELRNYWLDEARDFTPWLAQPENINLLGEAIGIELEVQGQEQSVGPFSADILCKDTVAGHFVLIENQIEQTDHIHLGQLMTYAAGLDAVTIVWVSRRFRDEHRAALDWLNRITAEGFNFFGLEIELWKIGDSALAPKFNVVSQPNDWVETVKRNADAGGALSETQQLHLDFWTQFRQFMDDRKSVVRINRPSKDYWTTVAVGRTNFAIIAWNAMRDGRSGIHLSITGPNAKAFFRELKLGFGEDLENKLGALDWRELPDAKESQIQVLRDSRPTDKSTWPELNSWFGQTLEQWTQVLRPLVRDLTGETEVDRAVFVSRENSIA